VFIYIARRVMMAISVLLVALVATFVLFFAGPADPAQAMCGELRCTPQKLKDITHSLRLDRPVPEQFVEYFKGLFVGREITQSGSATNCSAPCLGYSFRTQQEVKGAILSKFPSTATLAVLAMGVFLTVGISTGVLAARRRGSSLDRFVVGFSQVFGAIPYYIVALLFALYFTVLFQILPRAVGLSAGIGPWFVGMIAPAIVLGLVTSTAYVRYTRASMVDTLAQDPVVTILGLDMAALLSGTLITEQIFGVDGVGRLAIQSVFNDDLPIIMGTVMIGCFLVVTMNLLVDIAYSFVDPRVRLT